MRVVHCKGTEYYWRAEKDLRSQGGPYIEVTGATEKEAVRKMRHRLRLRKEHKLLIITPAGNRREVWLPKMVANSAAKGIAMYSGCEVIVYGELGEARYDKTGGGMVHWNKRSAAGETVRAFTAEQSIIL